jgi:hypothetical protein
MRSFIFGTAFALVVATGAAGAALAGTGWGDASNGNKAAPHQVDATKKPAQGSTQPASN